MNNSAQLIPQKGDTLEAVLQLQLKNTRLFLDLLEDEQALLTSGRIDDLASLVADKDRVVQQLAQLDTQLNANLTALDFPEGVQGIKAWIAANHPESENFCDWEELLKLTRLARQLNQTNANIISTWLQYTRQTLNTLYSAAGHTTLYDPKGQVA